MFNVIGYLFNVMIFWWEHKNLINDTFSLWCPNDAIRDFSILIFFSISMEIYNIFKKKIKSCNHRTPLKTFEASLKFLFSQNYEKVNIYSYYLLIPANFISCSTWHTMLCWWIILQDDGFLTKFCVTHAVCHDFSVIFC